MRNVLVTILCFFIFTPIILFVMDSLNVPILNITKEYDWLAFIGAYMGAVSTLVLGIVSLRQNDMLSKTSEKISITNIKTEAFSKIIGCDNDYIDWQSQNMYGFKMNSVDNSKKETSIRFVYSINDERGLPLKDFYIKEASIYEENNGENNVIFTVSNNAFVPLEKSPSNDFFMPVIYNITEEELKRIIGIKNLMCKLDLIVRNSFNIENCLEITFQFKNEKELKAGWNELKKGANKIYYKTIDYKENL